MLLSSSNPRAVAAPEPSPQLAQEDAASSARLRSETAQTVRRTGVVVRTRSEGSVHRGGSTPGAQVLAAVSSGVKALLSDSVESSVSEYAMVMVDVAGEPEAPEAVPPDAVTDEGSREDESDEDAGTSSREESLALTRQVVRHAQPPARPTPTPTSARPPGQREKGPQGDAQEDCWGAPEADGDAGPGQGATETAPDLLTHFVTGEPMGPAAPIGIGSRQRVPRVAGLPAAVATRAPSPMLQLIGWGFALAVLTVVVGLLVVTLFVSDVPASGGAAGEGYGDRKR